MLDGHPAEARQLQEPRQFRLFIGKRVGGVQVPAAPQVRSSRGVDDLAVRHVRARAARPHPRAPVAVQRERTAAHLHEAPQSRHQERVAPLGQDDVGIVPAQPPVERLQQVRRRLSHEAALLAVHAHVEHRPVSVVRVRRIAVEAQAQDHERRHRVLRFPGRLQRRDVPDRALGRGLHGAPPHREQPALVQIHLRQRDVAVIERQAVDPRQPGDEARERQGIGNGDLNDLDLALQQVLPFRGADRDRFPDAPARRRAPEQRRGLPEGRGCAGVVQAGRPRVHEPQTGAPFREEPDGHPTRGGVDVKQVGGERVASHEADLRGRRMVLRGAR